MTRHAIIGLSRQRSRRDKLIANLWLLIDKLRKDCLIGEQVLDPREQIADELATLLFAAQESPRPQSNPQK